MDSQRYTEGEPSTEALLLEVLVEEVRLLRKAVETIAEWAKREAFPMYTLKADGSVEVEPRKSP